MEPQTLIIGCYCDTNKQNLEELLQIYMYVDSKKDFFMIEKLFVNGHSNTITDVKWSPPCGRDYSQIATCSIDNTIIVWRVDLYDDVNSNYDNISISYNDIFNFNLNKEVNTI